MAGVDVVLAATAESERLINSDNIRSEEVASLSHRMQLCVSGCLRTLSGRDDLVDAVLSTREGMRALDLAVIGHCRVLLGQPAHPRRSNLPLPLPAHYSTHGAHLPSLLGIVPPRTLLA
jgi:hypothetical protein